MAKNKHNLLENLRKKCLNNTDYSWMLLAAAIGIPESIKQIYDDVNAYTSSTMPNWSLQYPSWQIAALSISRPDLLKTLITKWSLEPNIDDFDMCTEWIYVANLAAKIFFKSYKLDLTATPWEWNDFTKPVLVPVDLISRPLKNHFLELSDIQNSVKVGGAALRALQTQSVEIELLVFDYYSKHLKDTSSAALAFLILLSKQRGFSEEIWIERLLDALCDIEDPIDLLYISGGLISTNWQIPMWRG